MTKLYALIVIAALALAVPFTCSGDETIVPAATPITQLPGTFRAPCANTNTVFDVGSGWAGQEVVTIRVFNSNGSKKFGSNLFSEFDMLNQFIPVQNFNSSLFDPFACTSTGQAWVVGSDNNGANTIWTVPAQVGVPALFLSPGNTIKIDGTNQRYGSFIYKMTTQNDLLVAIADIGNGIAAVKFDPVNGNHNLGNIDAFDIPDACATGKALFAITTQDYVKGDVVRFDASGSPAVIAQIADLGNRFSQFGDPTIVRFTNSLGCYGDTGAVKYRANGKELITYQKDGDAKPTTLVLGDVPASNPPDFWDMTLTAVNGVVNGFVHAQVDYENPQAKLFSTDLTGTITQVATFGNHGVAILNLGGTAFFARANRGFQESNKQ